MPRNYEPDLGDRAAPRLAPPEVSFHVEDIVTTTVFTITRLFIAVRPTNPFYATFPICSYWNFLWYSGYSHAFLKKLKRHPEGKMEKVSKGHKLIKKTNFHLQEGAFQ
jgi:hypothetical protein